MKKRLKTSDQWGPDTTSSFMVPHTPIPMPLRTVVVIERSFACWARTSISHDRRQFSAYGVSRRTRFSALKRRAASVCARWSKPGRLAVRTGNEGTTVVPEIKAPKIGWFLRGLYGKIDQKSIEELEPISFGGPTQRGTHLCLFCSQHPCVETV